MEKHTQAAARLRAWIIDRGLKSLWVAKQLNISEATLSRWLTEKAVPIPAFRATIEALTNGAVKAGDWE